MPRWRTIKLADILVSSAFVAAEAAPTTLLRHPCRRDFSPDRYLSRLHRANLWFAGINSDEIFQADCMQPDQRLLRILRNKFRLLTFQAVLPPPRIPCRHLNPLLKRIMSPATHVGAASAATTDDAATSGIYRVGRDDRPLSQSMSGPHSS